MGEKLIAYSALCAEEVSCWKMENLLEIYANVWLAETVVTASSYESRPRNGQVSNWCNVIHLWLAGWCAGVLSRRLSSRLLQQWPRAHWSEQLRKTQPFETVAAKMCRISSDVSIISVHWRKYIYGGHIEKPTEWLTAVGHCDFWAQTCHEVLSTRLRRGWDI